jgi:hypothetical protein
MLDFIRSGLPSWCPGPDRRDDEAVCADLEAIVAAVEAHGMNDLGRDRLNAALEGYAQIEWWGTFGELLSGETPFAKNIRNWFWSNTGPRSESSVISSGEAGRFSQLLQEYGI